MTLGRDFGREIEIVGGVKPSDRVIESPPDAILNGQTVRMAVRPAATPTAGPQPSVSRQAAS